MKKQAEIEFEESSGNIFADLGFEDAGELQARALIGYHVVQLLNDKNMKQREIAVLLEIKQSEVSHLLNGHFSRFTIDKLLDFLKRMNQKVTIEISPHRKGEPFHQVAFGAHP
ncbi:MAG: helix-turn-helix transcriptional regulator [Chloroflexota bacterium]